MASATTPPPIVLAQFKSTRKGPWTHYHLLSLANHNGAFRCESLNGKNIQPLCAEPPDPSLDLTGWGALTDLKVWSDQGHLLTTVIRIYFGGPGVRVEGYSEPVPIVNIPYRTGVFKVGKKPNFTVATAVAPAPAPAPLMTEAEITMVTDPHMIFSGPADPTPISVFLLKFKASAAPDDPSAYLLVGEYNHSADIYYYKPLPPGEDIMISITGGVEGVEQYKVKSITTDKTAVRLITFTRLFHVEAIRLSNGQSLRAYQLTTTNLREHVGLRLKQNFHWFLSADLFDASGGGGGGMPPPPTVIDASGAAVDTISHVAPPPLTTISAKGKVMKGIKSKLYKGAGAGAGAIATGGDLCPFVARQLLELAQLRKELCPVVAEEFSAGNTAVMPCGHLFAQIAIEESFKKEPGRCPACRQMGRPTYV